jgi:hypothetical protein
MIEWQQGQKPRHADAADCPALQPTPAPIAAPAPVQAAPVAVQASAPVQAPKPAGGLGRPSTPHVAPRDPSEGWTAYGTRALRYVLASDVTFTLPDEALDAGADAVNHAVAAAGISDGALRRLAETQRLLRALAAARRDAAKDVEATQASAPAQEAPPAAQAAPGTTSGGSGGSKVPRTPKPAPQAPSAGLPVPVPVAVPVAAARRRPAAVALASIAVADPF